MHTIQLQIEDSIYDDIVKEGIDVQDELKSALHKIIYNKEHKITNDINISLQDMKDAKSRPISELFSEL